MNTLNLIRKQINKAAALHNAQITHTSYRGVEYDTRCVESTESHGTFCYRGQVYAKWLVNLLNREGYKPSLFLSFCKIAINVSKLTQSVLNNTEFGNWIWSEILLYYESLFFGGRNAQPTIKISIGRMASFREYNRWPWSRESKNRRLLWMYSRVWY